MPRKPSVARYYITSASAVVLSLLLPMGSTGGVVSFVLILAGVFALSSFIKVKQGGIEDFNRSTGDKTLDAVIAQGIKSVEAIKKHKETVPGGAVCTQLDRLERLSKDIFAYLRDHPDKLRLLRPFLDYTLPTTLSLLDSRQDLSSNGGEPSVAAVARIDGMLERIADSFQSTLDRLYADKALDTEAEIDVLAGMLKSDGLDDPFNLNKGGNR